MSLVYGSKGVAGGLVGSDVAVTGSKDESVTSCAVEFILYITKLFSALYKFSITGHNISKSNKKL